MKIKRTILLGQTDGKHGFPKGCDVEAELCYESERNTVAPYLDIDLKPCPHVVSVSICWTVWNRRRTDCYIAGQCGDEVLAMFPTDPTVRKVHALWKRCHLNTLTPGSRPVSYTYPDSHYDAACRALAKVGLLYDGYLPPNDTYARQLYRYGTAWLVTVLPESDLFQVREVFGV